MWMSTVEVIILMNGTPKSPNTVTDILYSREELTRHYYLGVGVLLNVNNFKHINIRQGPSVTVIDQDKNTTTPQS